MSQKPNIVFIMSDDHARQRISAYAENEVQTPGIDRLADEGAIFNNCFCTNSICAPSRATILTGNYNHLNGVRTLYDQFDGEKNNIAKVMRNNGYQTAIIGKWHLGEEEPYLPTGFDHYAVLRGQGPYYDPEFITDRGSVKDTGYTTELITDRSINWLENRDQDKPFMLFCHHKAPHRNWEPSPKYKDAYKHIRFKHPETYDDDYETRGPNADTAVMKLQDMHLHDYKIPVPEGASPQEAKDHIYQRYMEDYMACISSVDDSVSEILDYLDTNGLSENTMVIYTSDQGFYTGEHGWFDKRFMYEESQCMPFLLRFPRYVKPGTVVDEMIVNIDFAPLFLDYAGIPAEELGAQGRTFRGLLEGEPDASGHEAVYYRYWEYPSEHNVYPHLGVRTRTHKLIMFEDPKAEEPEQAYWELYDLEADPNEVNNIYGQPGTETLAESLKGLIDELRDHYDERDPLFTKWIPDGPYYWEN